MNNMNRKNTMMESIPAAHDLRKVPGFNPLNFLRRTISQSGEKVLKLDLPYKKLWFRLACPNGRMLLNPLRITDQMAVFEARIYSDMDAAYPLASFTSTRMKRDVPGGKYIQAAQDEALNEALDNAGFGIQLCDVAQVSDGSGLGSEIPLSQGKTVETISPAEEKPAAKQVSVSAAKPTQPITAPISKDALSPAVTATQNTQQPAVSALKTTEPAAPVPKVTPPSAAPAPQTVQQAAAPAPQIQTEKTIPAEQPEQTAATEKANYTEDMSVEEICARMSLDEARAIAVTQGTCRGWTLGQVAEKRSPSLKWYLTGCASASNILKAGAKLLLEDLKQKKAG